MNLIEIKLFIKNFDCFYFLLGLVVGTRDCRHFFYELNK